MSDENRPLKQAVENQLERAKAFSEKVRGVYRGAYDKAVGAGKERIDEIVRVGEGIEPKIRSVIDSKIQSVQAAIDGLNQSLANKTIPKIRRHSESGSVDTDKENT